MDSFRINAELKSLYSAWREKIRDTAEPSQFSPPLLLSVPEGYSHGSRNILIFGQETLGWSWTSRLRVDFPLYPHDYKFGDLHSLKEFIQNEDAVDALQWAYLQFDSAVNQPKNFRSPYWRAVREIKTWGFDHCVTTNVSKFDFEGRRITWLDKESLRELIGQQSELAQGEICALSPKCAIFFTGPTYDFIIERLFPGAQFERLTETISKVLHPALPLSYRTNHPYRLQVTRQWQDIEELRKLCSAG